VGWFLGWLDGDEKKKRAEPKPPVVGFFLPACVTRPIQGLESQRVGNKRLGNAIPPVLMCGAEVEPVPVVC